MRASCSTCAVRRIYDADTILAPFFVLCETLSRDMQAQFQHTGVRVEQIANAPPMTGTDSADAAEFVRQLTGENSPASSVSYATEGGQFQRAGFPTVICGPGSIEQAHQPDEWMAVSQFEAGLRFMEKLAARLS